MGTSDKQFKKTKVTLKDIAEYTGVAQNTISRVLNHKPYYTKQMEEMVNAAAIKLGYITDYNAVALKSGVSKSIAIVYDDMVSPFYSYMTSIMASKFNSVGYDTIIFSNYGASSFLEYDLLRKVLSRNPDAIVSFIEPVKDIYTIIQERKIPFFIFGRDAVGSPFDCVCADEVIGGEIATQHLLDCDHKNVYYVGVDPEVKVCTDRMKGYMNALSKNNITFNTSHVFMTKQTAFDKIFDAITSQKKAGIFCYNDMLAFKFYQELNNKGLNIPADFAIVGYDNVQAILGLPMFVTTIDVDNHQMADVGAEVVLLKLKNPNYSARSFNKVHIPKLVRGNTT